MYRMLVVDDEPRIADGMCHLFKSKREMDLEVNKAYSGIEALEYLKSYRIDIVLSDIRMPEMDGLQLMDEIHKRWPDCKVIFLTGYDEFDYVYKAIHKPGVNYILKTEGVDAIVDMVKGTIKIIDEEMEKKFLLDKTLDKVRQALPLMQRDFICSILNGHTINQELLKDQICELDIILDVEKPVLLLVGKMEFLKYDMAYADKLKMIYKLKDIFGYYLNMSFTYALIEYESDLIVGILQPLSNISDNQSCTIGKEHQEMFNMLKGYMETIQNECKKHFEVMVSFAATNAMIGWDRLKSEFQLLKGVLSTGILAKNGQMLYVNSIDNLKELYGDKDNSESLSNISSFMHQLNKLEETIEKADEDMFLEKYCQIFSNLQKEFSSNNFFILEAKFSIASMFLNCINRWNLAGDIGKSIDLSELINLNTFKNLSQFQSYFKTLGIVLINTRKNSSKNMENEVIDRLHRYIDENLDKELSLTKLAELVYMNPSYLCRYYKQITGNNFTDQIFERRIQKAKQLLRDKSLKVSEVAAKIGFDSPSYFSLCFKKAEKLTPQEYRDTI